MLAILKNTRHGFTHNRKGRVVVPAPRHLQPNLM
jgi:hypothetical protein